MADFDFIIIGSGAAGLAAAQYAARANLSVAVFESEAAGGQALVITDVENYPGLYPAKTGFELTDAMVAQAQAFGAELITETVQSLDKKGDLFTVVTDKGQYTAYAALIATGAGHRKLDIPGEKEFTGRGVSYCASCDGPFFKNKRIAVIGGGDSACDEAHFLSQLSPQITLIHRRDTLRAQAAVAQRVLHNPRIKTLLNYIPLEIRGERTVQSIVLQSTVDGSRITHETDAVFVFVGMIPRTSLVETVKKDEGGYIVTDENMQTSVKGLFCAGDVRAKPFRQLVTATADGAIAAFCAGKYITELADGNSPA